MGGGAVRSVAKLNGLRLVPAALPAEKSVSVVSIPGPSFASQRLVFGAVPSFREAEEATVDLRDAFHKILQSSPVHHDQSVPSNSKHELVVKAFQLLELREVQDAVASAVSDPCVWSTVLNNPKMKDLVTPELTNGDGSESFEDATVQTQKGNSGNGMKNLLKSIKTSVVGMVTWLLSSIGNTFGSLSDALGEGRERNSLVVGLVVMVVFVVILKRS